jgi:hypothetical protein
MRSGADVNSVTINGEEVRLVDVVLLSIALSSWGYGFFYQTKARGFISREKLKEVSDVSILATGPMPPKGILSEEGLEFRKRSIRGATIFVLCVLLLMLLHS